MPAPIFPTKKLKKGENLFKEGETASAAYLIKNGYVSIWRTEGTKTINLATKAEGEIVGEMALIDDTTRSATVTAGCDVEVEIITRAQLDNMLSKAPETVGVILHQLLESLRCANDLIGMYASRPVSK
ncbi:MAG: cyclic nucleotide-binding domain-containing protein [Kiritimatiellae bacterium]|nr:cyclic nucleotide-binding domain-containing protein [Kiritimatiellia bacterium]MDD5520679.1 cyclic nucleotide-binding domain-containing protein [Kiritimatiellia bacterium]